MSVEARSTGAAFRVLASIQPIANRSRRRHAPSPSPHTFLTPKLGRGGEDAAESANYCPRLGRLVWRLAFMHGALVKIQVDCVLDGLAVSGSRFQRPAKEGVQWSIPYPNGLGFPAELTDETCEPGY